MRILLLAIGVGLFAAGVVSYWTGMNTLGDVSVACKVLGGPCPSGEADTLRIAQMEELGGGASIAIGLVLMVLGWGLGRGMKFGNQPQQ
ncbi:MAG: hypothetical protein HY297_04495 [Thaumarchaeota archaeon]|nr:hypothetical protein [Nitrososphaerota archaeon]